MTKVIAIKCPVCNYTVFSRARHDFRSCACGKVSIDGGFDYTKVSYSSDIKDLKTKQIEVPQTPKELYDDWNFNKDLYGLIPPIFKEENSNEN